MILPVPQETSEGVLSTVDTVVQRRDNPRRLRNYEMVFTPYSRLYNWLYNQLYEHSRFWRVCSKFKKKKIFICFLPSVAYDPEE